MALFLDPDTFKRLVVGSTSGPAAATLRCALRAMAAPYAAAMHCRNKAYDISLLPTFSCNAPVICVGNLSLGGTGKTPLVAWTARQLAAAGMRPAIVSRGYGAQRGQQSDEAAELAIVLPDVPHVADPNRVAAARRAVANGADAIVVDDGFQHRRLGRDLDIVAVDATDPFGCGFLFPRGLLREPLGSLARADAVVITRCSLVDAARRAEIRAELSRYVGHKSPLWAEATHLPITVRRAGGSTMPLESIRGKRIVACAGVGNPDAFRRSLESLGADVAAYRAFPDHHQYSQDDLDQLSAWARQQQATMLVTTLKDLVKIQRDEVNGIAVAAIEIAIDFLTGGEELAALVRSVAPQTLISSFPRGGCASAAEANTS
jgi:tetraacyldisaccharide 4'-kinase